MKKNNFKKAIAIFVAIAAISTTGLSLAVQAVDPDTIAFHFKISGQQTQSTSNAYKNRSGGNYWVYAYPPTESRPKLVIKTYMYDYAGQTYGSCDVYESTSNYAATPHAAASTYYKLNCRRQYWYDGIAEVSGKWHPDYYK